MIGGIAGQISLLGGKVGIDRQSAKIGKVLKDDAFSGGDIACETDQIGIKFHDLSIQHSAPIEENQHGCYNLDMLAERIVRALLKDCGVNPELPLVVGVSGGADSLCLLHCLRDAGFTLIIGHLDHAIRENSARQADILGEFLAGMGLLVYRERQDVPAFAARYKLGIEEAARLCRYHFLFDLAHRVGAQGVVVGHHADDQVETVLMHFLRGSGLSGLTGMQPRAILKEIDAELPIFRPMLGITRQEIQDYCLAHQLEVLEDESNADLGYFRNRLRHELIPILEEYNPGFRQALTRAAATLSADRDLLETLGDEAYEGVLRRKGEDYLVFERARFLDLRLSLRRAVLRKAFFELKPQTRDLGFEAVERALTAISESAPQMPLAAGLWVFSFEDDFVIAPLGYEHQHHDYPQLPGGRDLRLKCGGRVSLDAGWEISANMVDARKYKKIPIELKNHPLHAWLNPIDLEFPLEIRPMRTGERWSPLGMVLKHQKLSNFFVNQKIPRTARANWPLVASGGSILWVAGLRIAQAWRLTGVEAEVLHLQLHPPK